MTATRPVVPVPWLVANVVGMAMVAAGVVAIQSPATLPALASPVVAWALIGAGMIIESGAALGMVSALRNARREQAADRASSNRRA